MNKPKTRQCISCRTQITREGFIRLTKVYDPSCGLEMVIVDPNKHQLGRSAYVCRLPNCVSVAIKEKKILKMLRVRAKALENVIPALENSLLDHKKGGAA